MSAENTVRSEISSAICSTKANVCPFAIRLAWHASGTYDKDDSTPQCGGSDGATMRFSPEVNHGANAGLNIMQAILAPVKRKFKDLSYADMWTLAGVQAIKLMGGPDVPFRFGRTDDGDSTNCPIDGRLPDAALGAEHLREVFYRMGFNDQDIVVLSGGHTIGSCHENRSGFDGPWTTDPVKFDNEYYRNLVNIEWKPREWDGPLQYTDPSGKLMMLPTDLALMEDESFKKYVEIYASDEKKFFEDFAVAFGKLIALGCPEKCQPDAEVPLEESKDDKDFRDMAMHGNLIRMKQIPGKPNPNSKEKFSERTPLHKACYFGHADVVQYLLECGAKTDIADVEGDTPLHDACRLGHSACVKHLVEAGANANLLNKMGETARDLAMHLTDTETVDLLPNKGRSKGVLGCMG